ncbi:hypothetical protein M231_02611 [Tremella mesenterica]|uniref:Uncharacterized protein n=1 Tax=Tremella mesenterica TaxID=5217 RepID=A0A4Q1BQF3_TREME|nr:hypothetical protein M231_02611 [Tremella mesenterica]
MQYTRTIRSHQEADTRRVTEQQVPQHTADHCVPPQALALESHEATNAMDVDTNDDVLYLWDLPASAVDSDDGITHENNLEDSPMEDSLFLSEGVGSEGRGGLTESEGSGSDSEEHNIYEDEDSSGDEDDTNDMFADIQPANHIYATIPHHVRPSLRLLDELNIMPPFIHRFVHQDLSAAERIAYIQAAVLSVGGGSFDQVSIGLSCANFMRQAHGGTSPPVTTDPIEAYARLGISPDDVIKRYALPELRWSPDRPPTTDGPPMRCPSIHAQRKTEDAV